MAEEVQAHETSTSLVCAGPAEVGAGIDIALRVKVSCPSVCDLRGRAVRVIAQEGSVAEQIDLVTFDGAGNETDEFVVTAPTKPGLYTWTAVFPAQDNEGVLHEESSETLSFVVKCHATSMAIWDLPSPVVLGAKFGLKVGVKCSANCSLAGSRIEIFDQEDSRVATGTLSDAPWPGTAALYWTDVDLEAPNAEGYYTREARLAKSELEPPHEGTAYTFAFTTARAPEHVVTVEVIDKDTKTPINRAHVVLHPLGGYPYRGYTDETGVAELEVPKGQYRVDASKGDDYETSQMTVQIADDATIRTELPVAPLDVF